MANVFDVFLQTLQLALSAIGGAMALLPEIAKQVVDGKGWLSASDLVELATIGQACPGPNMLVVTLIGWKVAGIPGAFAATIGFCLPSATVISSLYGRWEGIKNAPWKKALQAALAPVAAGMVLSGATSMFLFAKPDFAFTATVLLAAMADHKKLFHPVALLGVGAVVGLVI